MPKYDYMHIDERLNFGRHKGMTISDVLEIDPTYIEWCQKEINDFILYDSIIEEIRLIYPKFIMDYRFEEIRLQNLSYTDDTNDPYCDDSCYETNSFDRYNGSWAQDIEGYSDDDIDTIFDGDPDAYWNID